jgi:pyruvate dehydrogenase E2 component (dihydrolipoamide acetyltransferase)
MATEVIMPKVDMVMDSGTFVEWLKNEGDHVEKGEPLFIILTDKANIEIEAPASGILAGLKARPDDVIPVTEVIAYILKPGESLPSESRAAAEATPAAQVPTSSPQPEPIASEAILSEAGSGDSRVRATPAARRVAAELGVDLALVSGSGARGRVHQNDVLTFAEQQRPAVEARPPEIPLPDARQKEVIPLTGPRKIIAERMAYSAFTAPHITLSLRVDMSETTRLRVRVQEPIQRKTGHRLSFTAIVARAVASLLPRHPYLNASLQGDQIIIWDDVHLGIATSLEDYSPKGTCGLIVPVIRAAQTKSLERIVSELGDLVERARVKRLAPVEMSGSTFTISNLGMFDIESFTAIINPPESAILAVGKIVDAPVGTEDGIELRPMMNVTLSADHRVVDGATAARFLAELKASLENPYLLI